MTALADFTREDDAGGTIRFHGDLSLANLGDIADRLDAVDGPVARIDLSELDRIDTVGAWLVQRLAKRHDALSLRALRAAGISPESLRAEW